MTGKYKPQDKPGENTRFTSARPATCTRPAIERAQLRHRGAAAPRRRGRRAARDAGVAWVMANPLVTAPLLGASRPEQLDATLAAAEYTIDADLKRRLDELTTEYRKGDAPR
ncbi:MAG: aldo/keto reductase [Variovorax sp.]